MFEEFMQTYGLSLIGANKWTGIIYGLEIRFEAESEETCIQRFHDIVDEHLPDPD